MNIRQYKIRLEEPDQIKRHNLHIHGNGVHSFIYTKGLRQIKNDFDRDKICLKVMREKSDDIEKAWWGPSNENGSLLLEATKIQNIYWINDLAPRVYGIIRVNDYWAHVTDYLGKFGEENEIQQHAEPSKEIMSKIETIATENRIKIYYHDWRVKNEMDGKWIDFQSFRFKDDYEDVLRKEVDGVCNWHPPGSYQEFPEIELKGRRDNEHRIKALGLDKIDFEGKTVLDIGCSAGAFCNYAEEQGAKRVVGLELPERADTARKLSNFLGYFNIDYYGVDLKKATHKTISDMVGIDKFDIVLFLSMGMHIGYPSFVKKFVKDLLIYEGNCRDDDEKIIKEIKRNFEEVNEVGETKDLFNRPVIWAR